MKTHDAEMPTGNDKLIMWRLEKLEEGQQELKEGQKDLKESVDAVCNRLQGMSSCPNPFACADLAPEVEKLDTRVKAIEDARLRAEGMITAGTWVGKLVYTLAAAGVLQLLVNVWNFFNK